MQLDHILCVFKKTAFEHYQESAKNKKNFFRLSANFRQKVQRSHERQKKFFEKLQKLLHEYGLSVEYISDDITKINHLQKPSLVISCGGDGTFLYCAQHFPDAVLLGMNSDFNSEENEGSVGALTSVNHTNLELSLLQLSKGNVVTECWSRLGVKINGKTLDRLAVNEVFIGNPISFLTCDLSVELDGAEFDFNCSGIILCTGMGSNAWFKTAGGSQFSNDLKAYGYHVLLPSEKWNSKFSSGVLNYKKKICVRPHRSGYVLAFDSQEKTYLLKAGDKIEFFLALKKPVKVLKILL